jgi:hypothetical protein
MHASKIRCDGYYITFFFGCCSQAKANVAWRLEGTLGVCLTDFWVQRWGYLAVPGCQECIRVGKEGKAQQVQRRGTDYYWRPTNVPPALKWFGLVPSAVRITIALATLQIGALARDGSVSLFFSSSFLPWTGFACFSGVFFARSAMLISRLKNNVG